MMARQFAFGDLVVCTSNTFAGSTAAGGASVGILAELRKNDCRVQYLKRGRSVWVPLGSLRAARPEEVKGTLEQMVAGILSLLEAAEMEFMNLDPGRCRLLVSHGTIKPETVDELRARLGERLLAYLIRPQGLHRTQTVLEIKAG